MAFDWVERLNNRTDAEWVVEHADDYPQVAVDAARVFLERFPSMLAKELAHNFQHVIEAHHQRAQTAP